MPDTELRFVIEQGFKSVNDNVQDLREQQDKITDKITKHTIKLELLEDKLPEQPCEKIKKHLEEHEADKKDMNSIKVSALKKIVELAIAAGAAIFGYKWLGQ